MSAKPVVLFLCAFVLLFSLNSAVGPKRRFEYKYSFKGPHLIQRDGSIPFWQHGGDAIASAESIRINPSLKNKRGWVWNKDKTTFAEWEIQVAFRVSGRGRIGADGLAVWFTEENGEDGNVFGGKDKWKGLGLFLDSFDNDGQHNNPYIMAMVNDGTMSYNHNSDGQSQQLGGCLRDFRNKPYPVRVKVEYYKNALSVWFNNGMSGNSENYELCLRAENVQLPASGYFGLSGATGGLADDHDALSFLTHSLADVGDTKVGQEVSEEQRKKYEEEFDEYYGKLEKAKEDFQKEHPDQVKTGGDEDDVDSWFEEQGVRELKLVLQGQQSMHSTVSQLHQKLDEVVGRQERILSQISSVSAGAGQQQPPAQGQATSTIERHEVDSLISSQDQINRLVNDIKTLVADVQQKTTTIHSNQGQAVPQQVYQDSAMARELRDKMNSVDDSVTMLLKRPAPQAQPPCPPIPQMSCLNTVHFIVFLAVQTILIIGYMILKGRQEAQAKKFY